jgi:hypothetical protein
MLTSFLFDLFALTFVKNKKLKVNSSEQAEKVEFDER